MAAMLNSAPESKQTGLSLPLFRHDLTFSTSSLVGSDSAPHATRMSASNPGESKQSGVW